MDTKSKVLVAVLILVVALVTAWKYDTYVVQHDYVVYDQLPCDPSTESCFVYTCDEGDPECDNMPFKKIEKSASNVPLCPNYIEDACPPLTCEEGEEGCVITLCSEEALEEGEECSVAEERADEDDSLQTEEPDLSDSTAEEDI